MTQVLAAYTNKIKFKQALLVGLSRPKPWEEGEGVGGVYFVSGEGFCM